MGTLKVDNLNLKGSGSISSFGQVINTKITQITANSTRSSATSYADD